MGRARRFWRRFGEWWHSARVERDLQDEIASHVDHLADEYRRRGFDETEARRRARIDLGGVASTREGVRDARGLRPLDDLVRDVRHAFRLLARAPGFTLTVVATLALGIGANTAIFSLVDAVVLRPLPYPHPERLVSIWENVPDQPGPAGPHERIVVAPANFRDYAARATSFSAMAAFQQTGVNLTGTATPQRLLAETASLHYFDTLGVRPALGRPFSPGEFTWGHQHVAILADRLWRSVFGADPGVLGRPILLNGVAYDVVGVMPPDFVAPSQAESSSPVSLILPLVYGPDDDVMTNRQDHRVDVVARLRPGVSVETARAELATIAAALGREFPDDDGTTVGLAPLRADQVRNVRIEMIGLLAAAGLVLLVACVNVAGLVMVRSLAGRREAAIRTALGATLGRLLRSLLTEGLVLAMLGALAGLAVAVWTRGVLVSLAPRSLPYAATATLDWRVLAFAGVVAAATGMLFALLPAWQLRRSRPHDTLRATERLVTDRWLLKSRSGLLVAEIALSTTLLVGAGLMVRSFVALNDVSLGFNPDGVLAASVVLPRATYATPASRLAFFEAAAERLGTVPGVRTVAFATHLPLRGSWGSGFELEHPGAPPTGPNDKPEMETAGFQAVSPEYFATLGIPLVRGRLLDAGDRSGREPGAVVSAAFGRDLLSGADPIGRRFRRAPIFPWIRIVGVVGDIRRGGHDARIEPQVYLPAAQTELYPPLLSNLAVKITGDAGPVADAIRQTVWSLDPDQPVTNVRTLAETLALGQAERRFQTFLFALFAVVALVLSVIGVYGLVAYAVSQRTAEIGLRLALGASPARIIAWMVRQAAWQIAAGVVAGISAALLLTRYVASILFGITPLDPPTYLAATTALALTAIGAAWLAARRATAIDPLTALR